MSKRYNDQNSQFGGAHVCDKCEKTMESGKIVSIPEYGQSFHPACFAALTGAEMLHFLGIDEVLVETAVSPTQRTESQLRVRDARDIKADGTVAPGKSEVVYWDV